MIDKIAGFDSSMIKRFLAQRDSSPGLCKRDVNGAISKFLQTSVNARFHALLRRTTEQASNGFVRVLSTKDVLRSATEDLIEESVDRSSSIRGIRTWSWNSCGRRIYIGVGNNWRRLFHRIFPKISYSLSNLIFKSHSSRIFPIYVGKK